MEGIDPTGVCRIKYGFPMFADSSSPKPRNMAAVRRIEFGFHMTENDGSRWESTDFTKGPLGHWMDRPRGGPDPPLKIILTCIGKFKEPMDYRGKLCTLNDLARVIGDYWSETVMVSLQHGAFGSRDERGALLLIFESHLGPATMLLDDHHFKFNPVQNRKDRENGVPSQAKIKLESY